MAHRLRWYVANLLYEVTIRTLFGQLWLRPDPACRAIINGVFGKALRLYPAVRLYAFDAQSNHLHYLCSADEDPEQLPLFIDYVHGNIARQINALREREGVFWSRRGSVIAVLDGDAQIERLRYILAQGPKSTLVASPADWPGACSTPALLGDMRIPAVYRSLDERRRNARRPKPRPEAELEHDVAITLTPLPVWADLDAAALRAKHAELVADIIAEHRDKTFMGVARLVAQDPAGFPSNELERSAAPPCHALGARIRARFLAAYDTFRDLYKRAFQRLRHDRTATRLEILTQYPPGALAPPPTRATVVACVRHPRQLQPIARRCHSSRRFPPASNIAAGFTTGTPLPSTAAVARFELAATQKSVAQLAVVPACWLRLGSGGRVAYQIVAVANRIANKRGLLHSLGISSRHPTGSAPGCPR